MTFFGIHILSNVSSAYICLRESRQVILIDPKIETVDISWQF